MANGHIAGIPFVLFFFRRFFFSLKRKSGKRKSFPYFPEMVMPSKAM